MTTKRSRSMNQEPDDARRREVLRVAASLAVAPMAMGATASDVAPGKAGDFNFLAGEWKIKHRRLKGKEWDLFDGEATCWTILGGIGSVEELRIPARDFSGMGLRLLDLKQRLWCDYWVNARFGVLTPPPTTGSFKDGVGIFIADDMEDGKPIKARGTWDRITSSSCRWSQAVSRDGGRTWEDNWVMDWKRA